MTMPTRHALLTLSEPLLTAAVQMLIADSPELLLPPDVSVLRPSARLCTARTIVGLCGELLDAFRQYHALTEPCSPSHQSEMHEVDYGDRNEDDFQFPSPQALAQDDHER